MQQSLSFSSSSTVCAMRDHPLTTISNAITMRDHPLIILSCAIKGSLVKTVRASHCRAASHGKGGLSAAGCSCLLRHMLASTGVPEMDQAEAVLCQRGLVLIRYIATVLVERVVWEQAVLRIHQPVPYFLQQSILFTFEACSFVQVL